MPGVETHLEVVWKEVVGNRGNHWSGFLWSCTIYYCGRNFFVFRRSNPHVPLSLVLLKMVDYILYRLSVSGTLAFDAGK
jgi:hypothetical protein